jgi:hypothetical protein
MTPKEKAKELVDRFEEFADDMECNVFTSSENRFKNAKQCAIIAIDLILDELLEIVTVTSSKYIIKHINYYQEVKHEIEKL